ncbi:hypothetical protein PRECH8_24440 [Insulibacter thermoxylanivorax]|uniref:Uncharacterized protein n=1 Tax=Insulibacter thermoxylanivorax TaxID=2749268 RepID=A0A916QGR0_9BACL|nr:hypothetical protein [Insulibacter thermoxylanivorax]GFR39148.1 hypothetical protein PRECH8_24440 [Insulibacter thermoxylanivorax]
MNILHNGKTIKHLSFDDAQLTIRELNMIVHHLIQQGQVVKTITIDGIDVTGTFDAYIKEHHDRIQTIGIESVSPDEMMASIYDETIDYLQRVHQSTETLSDLFYGQIDQEAWNLLSQLAEGLNNAVQLLQMIAEHRKTQVSDTAFAEEVTLFINSVEAHVADINEAIEDYDTVEIGDILKYELGSTISKILAFMKTRVQ